MMSPSSLSTVSVSLNLIQTLTNRLKYRIKIDGNKIFRDTDYYYVTDIITGEERMVTKRWVLDNIVYIVNAAASKKVGIAPYQG